MSRPWFRMYAEFASDPKVQLLSFDDQRHFIVLLCLKCNGTLDSKAPTPEMKDRMTAKALGLDSVTAAEVRRRLVEVGVIREDWQPTKWDDRQYESDLSTDRVRRFRQRNGSETFQKRCETVSETDEIQNRTDTEQTEGAKAPRKRPSRRCPPDFLVTDDLKTWAVAECPGVNVERETAKFRDYEFRNSRSDWPATWRSWMRKAAENAPRSQAKKDPFKGALRES